MKILRVLTNNYFDNTGYRSQWKTEYEARLYDVPEGADWMGNTADHMIRRYPILRQWSGMIVPSDLHAAERGMYVLAQQDNPYSPLHTGGVDFYSASGNFMPEAWK